MWLCSLSVPPTLKNNNEIFKESTVLMAFRLAALTNNNNNKSVKLMSLAKLFQIEKETNLKSLKQRFKCSVIKTVIFLMLILRCF